MSLLQSPHDVAVFLSKVRILLMVLNEREPVRLQLRLNLALVLYQPIKFHELLLHGNPVQAFKLLLLVFASLFLRYRRLSLRSSRIKA
jgi:hypothetical protein